MKLVVSDFLVDSLQLTGVISTSDAKFTRRSDELLVPKGIYYCSFIHMNCFSHFNKPLPCCICIRMMTSIFFFMSSSDKHYVIETLSVTGLARKYLA